jgi:hypothetical protein
MIAFIQVAAGGRGVGAALPELRDAPESHLLDMQIGSLGTVDLGQSGPPMAGWGLMQIGVVYPQTERRPPAAAHPAGRTAPARSPSSALLPSSRHDVMIDANRPFEDALCGWAS